MKRSDGVVAYFALACGITWALDVPLTRAFVRGAEPPAWALACAGLSAFGPTIAAALVAAPRGELGLVFGRWRTAPIWVVVAVALPALLRLPVTAIERATLGHPDRWLYLPDRPEYVAAAVLFPIGEEFGWRGFAHPRMEARFGPVAGPLLVGLGWAAWHALMIVTPAGQIDLANALLLATLLPPCSVLAGWLMRRSGGSMLVAIAFHAGAHLDNINHAPAGEWGLRAGYVAVAWLAAAFAGRAMLRERAPA
ncbi:MAG: CPBP family intramembrane glutamic endopeptidase [Myxococcota bacterium]